MPNVRELLERYREWNRRREEVGFVIWEKIRQKGKKRYIARTMLFWSFYMTAAISLSDLLFSEPVTLEKLGVRFVFSVLGGFVLGFVNWNSAENAYLRRHPVAEGINAETYDITGRTT